MKMQKGKIIKKNKMDYCQCYKSQSIVAIYEDQGVKKCYDCRRVIDPKMRILRTTRFSPLAWEREGFGLII